MSQIKRKKFYLLHKFVLLVLSSICVFSIPARCDEPVRALFVSVVQDPPVLSSREEITKLIDLSKKAHIKILFVQIYRADQAWFLTKIADPAPYKESFKNVLEDPLALLIKQAHREGIEVHAWLNLLSLAKNTNANFLKKYGTDILTQNLQQKKRLEDYKIDEQYFLEPGDPRVKKDLTKIVKEILRTYPELDGIQFDYIRYPDMKPHYGYTKVNEQRFMKATGLKIIDEESPVWKDWKRKQVTELLAGLVKATRSLRPHIQVSTTGCMPYVRAYYEAYQDWPTWISQGLVDFVTIMSYSPDVKEFERTILMAKTKVKDISKIKIGVGAYRFVNSPKIFEAEFRSCEKMGGTCAVFHYGSLLENSEMKDFLINREKSSH